MLLYCLPGLFAISVIYDCGLVNKDVVVLATVVSISSGNRLSLSFIVQVINIKFMKNYTVKILKYKPILSHFHLMNINS